MKCSISRQRQRLGAVALCLAFGAAALAQPVTPHRGAAPEVGFAVIKTAKVSVMEGLLKPGGSFSKKIDSNFSAFLIKHQQDYLLFDTGMGSQIAAQYRQDMALWLRPFFKYEEPVVPARLQLDRVGLAPPAQVILSHSHWDHASGVTDFPEARIGVSAEELVAIRHPSSGAGGTWASQVTAKTINWHTLVFTDGPFMGFANSLDLFRDGTVVLVPMPGHTPGSLGLFVTVDSGRVYFFIGDVAWTADAVRAGAPKFWAAGLLVDHVADQTQRSVEQVRELLRKHPDMVVVPAHDSEVQGRLGYFPNWVK
jgi:glyoxylase-like metal-dependent hydrolase (beta-lactamase superfamily II)